PPHHGALLSTGKRRNLARQTESKAGGGFRRQDLVRASFREKQGGLRFRQALCRKLEIHSRLERRRTRCQPRAHDHFPGAVGRTAREFARRRESTLRAYSLQLGNHLPTGLEVNTIWLWFKKSCSWSAASEGPLRKPEEMVITARVVGRPSSRALVCASLTSVASDVGSSPAQYQVHTSRCPAAAWITSQRTRVLR